MVIRKFEFSRCRKQSCEVSRADILTMIDFLPKGVARVQPLL